MIMEESTPRIPRNIVRYHAHFIPLRSQNAIIRSSAPIRRRDQMNGPMSPNSLGMMSSIPTREAPLIAMGSVRRVTPTGLFLTPILYPPSSHGISSSPRYLIWRMAPRSPAIWVSSLWTIRIYCSGGGAHMK